MDISVLILARDRAETLPQAIASVIAQTTSRRLDVIIAHASSAEEAVTDRTAAIAREYERRYDRPTSKLRFAFVADESPAAVLNRALQQTNTPYVAFLDAEDRWDRFKLERQLTAIRTGAHIGLVHTTCEITAGQDDDVNAQAEARNTDQLRELQSPLNSEQGLCVGRCLETLLCGCSIPFSSIMAARTALDQITDRHSSNTWFDEQSGQAFFDKALLHLAQRTQFVLVSENLTTVRVLSGHNEINSLNYLRTAIKARLTFMNAHAESIAINDCMVREQLSARLLTRLRMAEEHRRHDEVDKIMAIAEELGLVDERFTVAEVESTAKDAETASPPQPESQGDKQMVDSTANDKQRLSESDETTFDADADAIPDEDRVAPIGAEFLAKQEPTIAKEPQPALDMAARSTLPAAESGVYTSSPMQPPCKAMPSTFKASHCHMPNRGLFQRLRDWLLRFIGRSF